MSDTLEGLTYREVTYLSELVEAEVEARDRHGDFDHDPELEALGNKLLAAIDARTERGNDLLASLISPTGGI
jgi:hypothetical protein